jgi:surface protein
MVSLKTKETLLKFKILLVIVISNTSIYANNKLDLPALSPFITTWQTDANTSITIPLTGLGYDFSIEWGDGSMQTYSGSPGNINHIYLSRGIKTIRIQPNTLTGFPRIYVNNTPSLRDNLMSIENWGSGQWGLSLEGAFFGAKNLEVNATDTPVFSLTTSFKSMFQNCASIREIRRLNEWDVSKVENMQNMFSGAIVFNSNISKWKVSNVKNMSGMFFNAHAFNQDLSKWDVSKVTTMKSMFSGATVFNSNISNWDVSKVTTMKSMFSGATVFNSNISQWNVSSAANMSFMFQNAIAFNQDLSKWDVAGVTNMSGMFARAFVFNSNIKQWNVSNVTDMSIMFYKARAFNQDLSKWNVSKVTNMASMFSGASVFNSNINDWNVSKVTNLGLMFFDASAFNSDMSDWNVSNVTSFVQMFHNAKAFNGNISNWKLSADPKKNISMESMFKEATSFNQDIGKWNVERVNQMQRMFQGTPFNQDIGGWDVSNVTNLQLFLSGGKLSIDNYDSLLLGWTTLKDGETKIPVNILEADFGSSKYSNKTSVVNALIFLIVDKKWGITDAGKDTDIIIQR